MKTSTVLEPYRERAEPAGMGPGGRGWRAAPSYAAIMVVAVLLWALRWAGPIDLRYDGAVYYVLGTSIAEGKGYRLLNEPGEPEGVQYPPLLPALVAGVQTLAGTTEPAEIAVWLRRGYAVLFAALAVLVLAWARRFLAPLPALVAAGLCMMQPNMYLVSDVLFTELPFTVVVAGLALVPGWRRLDGRPAWREGIGGVLASAAFLLRSAGIAALAAWVGEAVLRRRWRLALGRAALAAVPVLAWQSHVARVQASEAYRNPAYAYQRADYQFYNVPYAANMALVDPFRPELGRATMADWAARIGANLAAMPAALGEAVSGHMGFWRALVRGVGEEQVTEQRGLNAWARFPLWVLGGLAIAGLGGLARRGERFAVLFVAGSTALVCTTPWPGQFGRYMTPCVPFLAVAALGGITMAVRYLGKQPRETTRRLRWAAVAVGGLAVAVQVNGVRVLFQERQREPALNGDRASLMAPRLFFHGQPWRDWQRAVDWVAERAERGDVVATTSPHLCYLRTGLRAVMPPMERDGEKARALLEEAGVKWAIVDGLTFLDISRRYALPAVAGGAESGWKRVSGFGTAAVYRRVAEDKEGT